ARAASVDFAVDELPAPRVARPAFAGADRKDVDVPIERQMTSWLASGEVGDNVRHRLVRGDDLVGHPVRIQERPDVPGSAAGVARRIGSATADKLLKKGYQEMAIPIDALEQSALCGLHRHAPIGSAPISDATGSTRRCEVD